MEDQWVILELTSKAEGEDPDLICQAIQAIFKRAEIFIPASVTQVGDDRVVHYLLDGYAFVRRGNHKVSSFLKLEDTRYVHAVLTDSSRGPDRSMSIVPPAEIDRMRDQITSEVDQGICIGDKVLIISGPYRNITATVVEEIPEEGKVQVFVKLRSKQTIVTLPRSFLSVTERTPLSPALSRLTALGSWVRSAKPVLDWVPKGWVTIQSRFETYRDLVTWTCRGLHLYACASFEMGGFNPRLVGLQASSGEVLKLSQWLAKSKPLTTFVESYRDDSVAGRFSSLQTSLVDLAWFDDVVGRVSKLRYEINDLAHKEAKRHRDDIMVIQNVLIDGHNLALRCLYAPGMDKLTDNQGRPTGMILGFLRSITALKKRFPDARFYVAWDGSSRRRKQQFGDYKANRPDRSAGRVEGQWDPFKALQEMLPLLGVRQAFNAEEEADDILATLARVDLKDQHNLIFSNDKDFLQLVTTTTVLLTPGAGTRKETLFDKPTVRKVYGINPQTMVHLRAFYGDKSDNLPGVPRVPKKVLRALVQVHGSVAGVYKSGLTGVTKQQYERLRSSEPQVKINLKLMTLMDIPVSMKGPNVDPDQITERLRELSINPEPLVGAFLGHRSETVGL